MTGSLVYQTATFTSLLLSGFQQRCGIRFSSEAGSNDKRSRLFACCCRQRITRSSDEIWESEHPYTHVYPGVDASTAVLLTVRSAPVAQAADEVIISPLDNAINGNSDPDHVLAIRNRRASLLKISTEFCRAPPEPLLCEYKSETANSVLYNLARIDAGSSFSSTFKAADARVEHVKVEDAPSVAAHEMTLPQRRRVVPLVPLLLLNQLLPDAASTMASTITASQKIPITSTTMQASSFLPMRRRQRASTISLAERAASLDSGLATGMMRGKNVQHDEPPASAIRFSVPGTISSTRRHSAPQSTARQQEEIIDMQRIAGVRSSAAYSEAQRALQALSNFRRNQSISGQVGWGGQPLVEVMSRIGI